MGGAELFPPMPSLAVTEFLPWRISKSRTRLWYRLSCTRVSSSSCALRSASSACLRAAVSELIRGRRARTHLAAGIRLKQRSVGWVEGESSSRWPQSSEGGGQQPRPQAAISRAHHDGGKKQRKNARLDR